MPSILDQILAADRRRTATVGPFPLRGDDADRLREARDRLDKARRDHELAADTHGPDDPTTVRRAERLADAETALEEVLAECPSFLVHVHEVSPPERVDELIAEHPPTAEQNKRARAEGHKKPLLFNEDTFPVAFIHAALDAIEMDGERQEGLSLAEVTQLYTKLNSADRSLLFSVPWTLRTAPTMVGPLGKG